MRRMLLAALVVAGSFGFITSAAAQAPVAVVEEVKGKPAGVEFMDYLAVGKVIKLGPKDTIVIGYMKSCWRETITGGTVVVGAEQSLVHLGEAERIKVDCDGGKQSLTDRQARESAATVFRGMSPAQPAVSLAPGGVYAASFGGQRIVFKVDAEARPGATPVIGRLLRFK